MYIIIPALISNEESSKALQKTIDNIEWKYVKKLILISQGEMPKITLPQSDKFVHEYYDKGLTKWIAIQKGFKYLEGDEMVMLLDGDDPIEKNSFKELMEEISTTRADWMVGKRDEIILYSSDQHGQNSRLYLELFTNTLLILLDELREVYKGNTPDIQSGVYIIRANILKTIDFSDVKSYGGELTIFHQLSMRGVRCESVDIVTNASLQSSYRFKTIVEAIFDFRFFKSRLNEKILRICGELTPAMYPEYFRNLDLEEYRREVANIVALADF